MVPTILNRRKKPIMGFTKKITQKFSFSITDPLKFKFLLAKLGTATTGQFEWPWIHYQTIGGSQPNLVFTRKMLQSLRNSPEL